MLVELIKEQFPWYQIGASLKQSLCMAVPVLQVSA